MPRSKRPQLLIRKFANELKERTEAAAPGCFDGGMTDNPLEGVSDWPGIELVMAEESTVEGGCSVSGSYDYARRRIVVARSASRRRQGFTALHELGHHLQQHDEASVALLEAEPDFGANLEDDICDALAGQVLIPDTVIEQVTPAKGPTAESVIELFEQTQASREACCVRAAQRIVGEGYVMLCDISGTAIFTACTGQYPVRRGTPQIGNVVVEAAMQWRMASRESRVTFPSGAQSPLFFGNAETSDEYIFVVMVSYSPAWVTGLTPSLPCPNPPIGKPE